MASFCLKSAILFFTQLYFIHIPGHFIALEGCRNIVEDNNLPSKPIESKAPKEDGAAIAQLIRQSIKEVDHD